MSQGKHTADSVWLTQTKPVRKEGKQFSMNTNSKSNTRSRNNWNLDENDVTIGDYTYTFTTFGGRFVFENTFNGKNYGPEATQTERILAFLSNGYSINQSAAMEMFGCKNLRAAMSVIRAKVERYDNWRVLCEEGSDGDEYSLKRVLLVDPVSRDMF